MRKGISQTYENHMHGIGNKGMRVGYFIWILQNPYFFLFVFGEFRITAFVWDIDCKP